MYKLKYSAGYESSPRPEWQKLLYVSQVIDADRNVLHVDASSGPAVSDNHVFNDLDITLELEELIEKGETVHLLGVYCIRYYINLIGHFKNWTLV